jgi:dTMP kinase
LGEAEIRRVNEWATAGIAPDLTVLLRIDPAEAAARAGETDRFEGEGLALQRAVADAYEAMAADDPGRWRALDAARDADAVAADLEALVADARASANPAASGAQR